MAISPDGKILYVPQLEGPDWHVVNAANGDVIATIETKSGSHNTIYSADGAHVYLAGLKSPLLSVADPKTHKVTSTVGPFDNVIRPFTVNGSNTLVFVNVNGLLGFEVGDHADGQEALPGRGGRLQARPGEAPRLPEPRHRAYARREGTLGGRLRQRRHPCLRLDRDAAEADDDHQGARLRGLGQLQHGRALRLLVDGRNHRCGDEEDRGGAHRTRPGGRCRAKSCWT